MVSMTRLLGILCVFLALCSQALAQAQIRAVDPCFGSLKASAAINVASATTTSLVAVSGNTVIYVCGFSISIAPAATAATALFEYGTGASCTSPTALTGIYGGGVTVAASAADAEVVSYGGAGSTIFSVPAANGLCILTAGSAVSVQGVVTYVQGPPF